MDKITIRGEVEHTYKESGRVGGRKSLRDFCPRYLVNSLITQNNAWDKPYNRVKGEISNKKVIVRNDKYLKVLSLPH